MGAHLDSQLKDAWDAEQPARDDRQQGEDGRGNRAHVDEVDPSNPERQPHEEGVEERQLQGGHEHSAQGVAEGRLGPGSGGLGEGQHAHCHGQGVRLQAQQEEQQPHKDKELQRERDSSCVFATDNVGVKR